MDQQRINNQTSQKTATGRVNIPSPSIAGDYMIRKSVKVMPGQEVQLNNGDIVRFADEDFEFYTN